MYYFIAIGNATSLCMEVTRFPLSDHPSWNVSEVDQLVDVDVIPTRASLLIRSQIHTKEK